MLVPLGLWLGIVGYGILYAGIQKLGGNTCSLGQAFRGQCQPAKPSSQSKASTTSTASGLSSSALPATAAASSGNLTP